MTKNIENLNKCMTYGCVRREVLVKLSYLW